MNTWKIRGYYEYVGWSLWRGRKNRDKKDYEKKTERKN
jgi:hypothetical protein